MSAILVPPRVPDCLTDELLADLDDLVEEALSKGDFTRLEALCASLERSLTGAMQ